MTSGMVKTQKDEQKKKKKWAIRSQVLKAFFALFLFLSERE